MIYMTNFKCGPDSYIKHFVRDAFGRPFLSLQFDGHANDAGMLTRIEAYLDSQGILRRWSRRAPAQASVADRAAIDGGNRARPIDPAHRTRAPSTIRPLDGCGADARHDHGRLGDHRERMLPVLRDAGCTACHDPK